MQVGGLYCMALSSFYMFNNTTTAAPDFIGRLSSSSHQAIIKLMRHT